MSSASGRNYNSSKTLENDLKNFTHIREWRISRKCQIIIITSQLQMKKFCTRIWDDKEGANFVWTQLVSVCCHCLMKTLMIMNGLFRMRYEHVRHHHTYMIRRIPGKFHYLVAWIGEEIYTAEFSSPQSECATRAYFFAEKPSDHPSNAKQIRIDTHGWRSRYLCKLVANSRHYFRPLGLKLLYVYIDTMHLHDHASEKIRQHASIRPKWSLPSFKVDHRTRKGAHTSLNMQDIGWKISSVLCRFFNGLFVFQNRPLRSNIY